MPAVNSGLSVTLFLALGLEGETSLWLTTSEVSPKEREKTSVGSIIGVADLPLKPYSVASSACSRYHRM